MDDWRDREPKEWDTSTFIAALFSELDNYKYIYFDFESSSLVAEEILHSALLSISFWMIPTTQEQIEQYFPCLPGSFLSILMVPCYSVCSR